MVTPHQEQKCARSNLSSVESQNSRGRLANCSTMSWMKPPSVWEARIGALRHRPCTWR